ncbi:DUF2513 domain-containing protein [Allobacillus sp. SKP2-8]|uniref:DUF2513 domain-containing protein n=1 Tax=unclassified Allobacillus TaxID=2628859 RepID=UPI001182FC61|nr:DUF2513 domain-containing protein [Allobacillus sp. SKP2-8]
MRRDMELVRTILIDLSKGRNTIELNPLDRKDELYDYHIEILRQANLIYYKNRFEDRIPRIYIDEPRLTWKGNNYLDNISDSNI